MAALDARVSRATDGASIALLRRLRAGEELRPYVHRADVCSAAPADLVANLMPAPPGPCTDHQTAGDDDGYNNNSVWCFYCPKRYKNTQGKASGYRQRGIGARGETRWHPEGRAKDVHGSQGGTFCTFSYGRMKDRSLERMGWCMVEYDLVDNTAAASNYVLCKVYRPSRAKGKQPPSPSCTCSSKSAATSSCSKRKADGSGNPEARTAKLIRIQREQVQMQQDNTFTYDYPMLSSYEHQRIDHAMFGHEEVHASAPDNYGEFVQIPCGPVVPVVAEVTVEDLLRAAETMSGECIGMTAPSVPLDDDFFVGVDPECLFGAQEEARSGTSSSQAPSSSTCLVEPVVMTEVTIEDLFGPEMMSGDCVSMPAANTPPDDHFFFGAHEDAKTRASSSSYLPSWSMAPSSSAGCSTPVQEHPQLPYMVCS